VDCETRPLKKRAKLRPQLATRKLPRRVWSSPHIPSRSGPEAAVGEPEPVAELAVAAVGLVAERVALVEPVEQEAAEARAEPEALVEREAVAEPEELAGRVAAEAQELRAAEAGQGQRVSTIRTIR